MTETQKKLIELVQQLPEKECEAALEYIRFLHSKADSLNTLESQDSNPICEEEPKVIQRPDDESVIAAIKRLSASYPMLDKATLLNQTSSLMTQHVMQGRSASEVIDDLEQLFTDQYQKKDGVPSKQGT